MHDEGPRIFFSRKGKDYLLQFNSDKNVYELALKSSNGSYYDICSEHPGFPTYEQGIELRKQAPLLYIPERFYSLVVQYNNADSAQEQNEIEELFRQEFSVYLVNLDSKNNPLNLRFLNDLILKFRTNDSSANIVQELKPGTVVKYNDELYLIRGFSSSGGLQLIKTDGGNYSGTPQPDKITAIIKQYPVITHNGTDYIVTDRDNIYTLAKSTKGSRLVFTADASNVGKDRNFLISRALVHRGKARFHESQNYIVTEEGVVYKSTGELYNSEYAKTIAKETYPEKFTTEPIAPVHVEPVVQNDDTTLGIVLNQGQQDAVDGVLKFLNDPTDYEPVIVNGKAGTGKTTIVNEILKKYGKRQSVWIVALSHKAKQVLMDKISLENKDRYDVKGKTIAASQGKTLDFNTGRFADGDVDTNFPAIMFVDEASMVEDEAFVKFLDIVEKHKTKIVFLGDSGQLPPIEENEKGEYKHKPSEISPVFKLSKQSKLTERVRQGEDSPILPYADYYWNYSHKMSKVLPTRADNVQIISSKGALLFDEVLSIPYSFFEKAIKTANPNLIKIVTYTNLERQNLNQKVHERFFGDAI